MDSPLLSLQDVTIRYPGYPPFLKISFQVKSNEHWAFIGENSSLINALMDGLAGKAIISNGVISFDFFGKFLTENNPGHKHISPQSLITILAADHNFRNLSGVNEAYYQQRYNSLDSENSLTVKAYLSAVEPAVACPIWTFEKTVNELHLQHLLDEHLIKLSNGESRRVLMAAALLRHPVILLLDHPFTGLDVHLRKEIKILINQISDSGITIIMSASANEIPECITHVAFFHEENKIQAFSKQGFHAGKITSFKKADKAALKALLSISPTPVFNTIVSMKNVCIRYGNKIILDNINWAINQGERWALSGPNGAGKTTLLSLINGDNPQAFANDIVLFDRRKGSGESIWDIKKKTGFFSEELYQYFPMDTCCLHSVESGFYDTAGLFRLSHSHTASIAFRWMEIMGIDHLFKKSLKNVSASERRLCLLARALVKNPPLLILDEPCQGFNEYEQLFFKDLITSICTLSNVTLIYISHCKDEIPESVTHFYKLQNGRQIK